ncbi:MAG: C25 family cysteine peptidase [Bacteroidetes bacterium]|nr:C25 family cysteine peptidase [Bacteroidota bacterium]
MKKALILSSIFLLNTYILCSNWYQQNLSYHRLITNKTGICKVLFNDLFAAGFTLNDKDTSGIRLVYRGAELPYYYTQNELIYCIPSANKLDEYSNDFAVFLYYDAGNNSENNTFLEADNVADTIEYIEQKICLEVDKIYYSGQNNLENDDSRFKGWYWKLLNTYPNLYGDGSIYSLQNAELVVEDIYLFPRWGSNISVKAYLTTTMSDSEYAFFDAKRNVASYFNNDSVSNFLFDSLVENKAFETHISSNWLGNNLFRLVNHRVSDVSNSLYLGVDNIEFSGYFKPYFHISTDNENSHIIYQANTLNIASLDSNSHITINGLSDSKVYLFDTIGKSFIIKDNTPVTHISVCTRYEADERTFMTSILMNNHNYKSIEQGIHIYILQAGKDDVESKYSYSYNSDVLSFVRDAADGSVICIAINERYGNVYQLNNFLQEQGSTLISQYSTSNAYVCAFKKGSNVIIEELNKEEKIACKDATFYDEERRWFSANISLMANNNYSLVYSDSSNVALANVKNVNQTNLKDTTIKAELIIIYHNDFKEKSIEYANYKRSKDMLVECVDVEDIYKEFGYGNKSPIAIKDYLRYAFYNWNESPKYVLFIGDASTDPRFCDTGSISIDYIPAFGYPVSDYWFGVFNSSDITANLIVGRIPVSNNTQLENYIEKVKVYESNDNQLWNKKFILINGGSNIDQINAIENGSKITAMLLNNTPLCSDTIIIYKDNDSAIIYKNRNEIIRELNSGVGMTIFHGHGSPIGVDNWGWQVDNLNNFNRYGILATLSCITGAFADNTIQSVLNEDFILSYKDRGFVASIGATTKMTIGSNRTLQLNMAEALIKGYRRIGDIMQYSKDNIPLSDIYRTEIHYTLGILGDPTIEIKIDTLTDIYALSREIIVTNEFGDTNLTDDNTTITIKVPIYNAGIYYGDDFNVKLEYNGISYNSRVSSICRDRDVEFVVPLNTISDQQLIVITLDSDNEVEENNKSNNIVTKTIRIFTKGLYPVEPLPYLVMNKNKLHFRFLKWQYIYNESYEFNISDENNNVVCASLPDEIYFNNEYVDWNILYEGLQEGKNYFVSVKQFNNNNLFDVKTIPFSVSDTVSFCDTCAELVFISANTGLDTNRYLRGDTAFFKVDLANISLRTAIENVILFIQIEGNMWSDTIQIIAPDEHIFFEFPIPTNYLQTGINYILATITTNDLYDFNNSFSMLLYVDEDDIPPTFKIYIDNALLTEKTMNISSEPYFIVEMYDNSYMPVLIEKPIEVRLNSIPLSPQNTQYYTDSTINEGNLKAILEFKIEPLTEKENLFRFIGTDASGNTLDTNYRLTFTINNHILSTSSYPLPSSNSEEVYIEYNLGRSEVGGTAILNIYDTEGKHIKEIHNEINSSQGIFIWQKDNKQGKKVAPAIYSYTIEVLGTNWMEPIFGKIVLEK